MVCIALVQYALHENGMHLYGMHGHWKWKWYGMICISISNAMHIIPYHTISIAIANANPYHTIQYHTIANAYC
jgi:hypothetical protein